MNELGPTIVAAVAGIAGAAIGGGLSFLANWLNRKNTQCFQREEKRRSTLLKAWHKFIVPLSELADAADDICKELVEYSSLATIEEQSEWRETFVQVQEPRLHKLIRQADRARILLLMIEDDENLVRELLDISKVVDKTPVVADPTAEQENRLREYAAILGSLSDKIDAILQKLARERYFV